MNTAPLQIVQAFRQKLLGIFPRRADALFELIDALLLTLDPRSPVELSLSPAFRRRFGMVYDALRHGQVDPELARHLLASAEPVDALEVAGYAVYALDSTVHPREDAETLADRGKVYSASKEGAVPGHQYSWLGRVIAQGQSWFAPREVERIATSTTPAGIAAEQVKRLALSLATGMRVVIVADSHYAKKVFLTAFVNLPNLCILVRLACNRVLYGPPPVVTGSRQRGRPRVHGDKFRLKSPPQPQRQTMGGFGKATVRLSAWSQLHFKDVPTLIGMVVRVALLERPCPRLSGSPVLDVFAPFRDRALLPFRQTTAGPADRPDARPGRFDDLGLASGLGLHPTVVGPDSRSGPTPSLGPQVSP
jgi:hypothetical protein